MKYETAYFVAYAKLQEGSSVERIYDRLTLGLEIELDTGKIVGVSCTLIADHAREMVKKYFLGKNIVSDLEKTIDEVRFRHQGSAQKPLIKALCDINRKYLDFIKSPPCD